MLCKRYSRAFLGKNLLDFSDWRSFPPVADREEWLSLSRLGVCRRIVRQANELLKQPVSELAAVLYLSYFRDGKRDPYEEPYFARRQNLSLLVFAECLEYKGRFLDEIINHLWAIIGEASWCVPAHAGMLGGVNAFPPSDRETIDLFNAQTGAVLAEGIFLLRDELNTTAPGLPELVEREIERRLMSELEKYDDYFWLQGSNNWCSWICFSLQIAAMYTVRDRKRLAALTWKLMAAVDRFIDFHPADGSCEEGPMYWGVSAGSIIPFLELLYSRSDGKIDIYSEEKIRRMGSFIRDIHLDGEYFFNFGDAMGRGSVNPGVLCRFGQRIGDESLIAFGQARERFRHGKAGFSSLGKIQTNINSILREFFWTPSKLLPVPEKAPVVWLPDQELMVARQSKKVARGMVLGAIASHNGLGHNHCDVGEFIVFSDGDPVFIDLGKGEYTKETFSDKRYELLWTRSAGHNVPLVNSCEQLPGGEAKAEKVKFWDDVESAFLGMNLEKVYPRKAGLLSYRRELNLNREQGMLLLNDSFSFSGRKRELLIPLLTACRAKIRKDGTLALLTASGKRLLLEFDGGNFSVNIANLPLDDYLLERVWQTKSLQQIRFEYIGRKKEDVFNLTVKQLEKGRKK